MIFLMDEKHKMPINVQKPCSTYYSPTTDKLVLSVVGERFQKQESLIKLDLLTTRSIG